MNASKQNRMNILLIISDQHNKQFMGNTGYDVDTPNLDALAADGTRFDSAYTACPLCVPARASFVTGRYPHEIGVHINQDALRSTSPTFAHAIGAAGYETALIGRMHFVGADQYHGFEKHLVGDIGSEHVGASNDLGPFIYNSGASVKAIQNAGAGITSHQHFDNRVAQEAAEQLRNWQARNEAGIARPFCYVVGMHLPHSPYRAPAELYTRYVDRAKLTNRPPMEELSGYVRRYRDRVNLHEATEEEELRALRAYCALTTHLDSNVGQVLDALDAIGQHDNTLVIYTSDHGDHAGQHRLWWKLSFYEQAAGVPLIARGPGVGAGQKQSCPVSLIDLAPTLIDWAGGEPLPNARGDSLLPLLRGESFDTSRAVLSELPEWHTALTSRMVRRDNYKLIHYHSDEVEDELYDLATDPDESNNLYESTDHKTVREELTPLLTADDWCPGRVTQSTQATLADARVMGDWWKAVKPEEQWSYLRKLPVNVNYAQDQPEDEAT